MAQPQGPLSYLSTVTTAGSSDWGSQALDTLPQPPSEAYRGPPARSTTSARTQATAAAPVEDAQVPDKDARASEAQGSNAPGQVSGKKQSLADRLLRKTGSGNRHSSSSRNSAGPEAAAPVSTSSEPQRGSASSKTQPSLASIPAPQVNDDTSNAIELAQQPERATPVTWSSDEALHSQSQSQQPGVAQSPQNQTEAPGWDAFGGSSTASAAQEPQQVTASQTASEHHWPAPGVSQAAAANDDWSAFGDPASEATDAAPAGLNDSRQEAAVAAEQAADDSTNPFLDPGQDPWQGGDRAAPAEQAVDDSTNPFLVPGQDPWHDGDQAVATEKAADHITNPFLVPGQDPWQNGDQAAPADSAEIARMASGDSFGDFNTSGEQASNGFEHAAWDAGAASAQDMTDWAAAAAAAPADPFAASASYNDFAALLEPAHTELVSGFDATLSSSAEPTSLQAPSSGQFDLSELQGDLSHGLQQELHSPGQVANQSSGTCRPSCCVILAAVLSFAHLMLHKHPCL